MLELILQMTPDYLVRHAPPLLVMTPLLIAGVMTFIPSGRLAWLTTIIAALGAFACAIILLAEVSLNGVVSYHMGGWAPPMGIEFRIDPLNVLFLLIVTGTAFLAAIFSWTSVVGEVRPEKRALFYVAFMVCFAGLSGVVITGDAFNLFVFLEISSISTYVLVALGGRQDRRAFPAAFNYLIMGTIGATFFVIGVGFLYAATGTLNMVDISERLAALGPNKTVYAGFAFIVVGLGVKAAMWPLHQWLPNAYTYAPSFVTMFLSATATKAAIYAIIRFVFTVFSVDFSFSVMQFTPIFASLAIIAMLTCSIQATFQSDIRRMLAYSSVAQVGYMMLGIAIGTSAGLSAGLFHLTNHAIIKGALFMAVAGVFIVYKVSDIKDFTGLGRAAPITMTAFAIAGLSLIGMPLTAGFQSKWALLQALIASGWAIGVVALILSSLLAVIYIGRVLQAVFVHLPEEPFAVRKEAPLLLLIPLWTLILLNFWIGISADTILGLINNASAFVFAIGGAG